MSKLEMKFDPKTIEHLWISLYSKLPTVLSELISNSWDADSDSIEIDFIDTKDKEIHYRDDGIGMTFDEINSKFLMIWRDRRKSDHSDITVMKNRKVIWKKGLWKLSVFWIAKEVEVTTVKGGIKNHFIMDIEKILSSEWSYEPEIIEENQSSTEKDGTQIILRKITRKTDFNTKDIGISISKKFLILDQINLKLFHNWIETVKVTNEMKFEWFLKEFNWIFPNTDFNFWYKNSGNIKWEIMTLKTPVKDTEMRGIYLTSRGKIVNNASFYGLRDNDNYNLYVTGYLEVDFIDELVEDVISTDRQSLNWENEEIIELIDFLHFTIKKIWNEWRKKRAEVKKEDIKNIEWIDIKEWQDKLPTYQRELSNKIINPVLEDPNIDTTESTQIISSVIDKFDNEDFKKYASDITDSTAPEHIPKLLKLMDDWQLVEAKQFSDLARTRISVIEQFEDLIKYDTKEVPTLHDFLKKFSWLLDPRIIEFDDEVTFSNILKDEFPDDSLDEKDRRIDFLCSNALWNILYVIEIKRSLYKIDAKALEQAYHYWAFLKSKYWTSWTFNKVVCYVVWWEKTINDYMFQEKEKTYMLTWEVFVKTYRELLLQAKQYHKEFIEKHEEISWK